MTSGVYAIRCVLDKRMYIGSSKNIEKRWKRHEYDLRTGVHHSKHMQRTWDKYGASYFEFFILEKTQPASAMEVEQWWIDNTSCVFNGSRKANAPELGPEARAALSIKLREVFSAPEHRKKLSTAQKAYRAANPEKVKFTLAALHSAESKAKVKAAHREKNRVYSAFGRMWCLKEIAEEYGVHYGVLKDRVRAGWELEKAVTTPKRGSRK